MARAPATVLTAAAIGAIGIRALATASTAMDAIAAVGAPIAVGTDVAGVASIAAAVAMAALTTIVAAIAAMASATIVWPEPATALGGHAIAAMVGTIAAHVAERIIARLMARWAFVALARTRVATVVALDVMAGGRIIDIGGIIG